MYVHVYVHLYSTYVPKWYTCTYVLIMLCHTYVRSTYVPWYHLWYVLEYVLEYVHVYEGLFVRINFLTMTG